MPGVAVAAAANVTVLDAAVEPLRLVGENVAATPVGNPEADSAMLGTSPLEIAVDTVRWPELPVSTLREVALALTVKLGVGMTSETVAVDVTKLALAVTVKE